MKVSGHKDYTIKPQIALGLYCIDYSSIEEFIL
jgi:hypothetical protein